MCRNPRTGLCRFESVVLAKAAIAVLAKVAEAHLVRVEVAARSDAVLYVVKQVTAAAAPCFHLAIDLPVQAPTGDTAGITDQPAHSER
jgi:hypothetical protein